MRKEYDFSKGERGKFYNKDANLNIPVYLEPKILSFVESIAAKRKTDISTVVNDLIKTDMKIAEYTKR
jgi:hypothetical protein